jgi:50S ribosomal subunit-associated GTPase HflX
MIYVFNKIDQMQFDEIDELRQHYKKHAPVFVSALEKTNLEALKKRIASYL